MGWEDKLPGGFLLTTVEKVAGYARARSVWPAFFGLACCAMELVQAGSPRHDLGRFGMERVANTPRQADLMIVAGAGASFGQPEIKLGVLPPAACVLLPRRCRTGLAAELVDLELELIDAGVQAPVLGARPVQIDVALPQSADPADRTGAGAVERRERLGRPHADQADIVFPADLEGQQEQLHAHRRGEQQERPASRRNVHWRSELSRYRPDAAV